MIGQYAALLAGFSFANLSSHELSAPEDGLLPYGARLALGLEPGDDPDDQGVLGWSWASWLVQLLSVLHLVTSAVGMVFHLWCMSIAAVTTILGAGLALKGPNEQAVTTATAHFAVQSNEALHHFAQGLLFFICSVVSWILASWQPHASLPTAVAVLWVLRRAYKQISALAEDLYLPPEAAETGTFAYVSSGGVALVRPKWGFEAARGGYNRASIARGMAPHKAHHYLERWVGFASTAKATRRAQQVETRRKRRKATCAEADPHVKGPAAAQSSWLQLGSPLPAGPQEEGEGEEEEEARSGSSKSGPPSCHPIKTPLEPSRPAASQSTGGARLSPPAKVTSRLHPHSEPGAKTAASRRKALAACHSRASEVIRHLEEESVHTDAAGTDQASSASSSAKLLDQLQGNKPPRQPTVITRLLEMFDGLVPSAQQTDAATRLQAAARGSLSRRASAASLEGLEEERP